MKTAKAFTKSCEGEDELLLFYIDYTCTYAYIILKKMVDFF